MTRPIIIAIIVALGFTAGGLALREAHAQAAAPEPKFLGEVNGVALYGVSWSGMRCVVTAPQGSVSCK